MFTAAEINAAIAAGQIVTARASDIERPRQPRRGATITLTQAFDGTGGDVRATAQGFKGRFRVADVTIPGAEYDTAPDTY